MGERRVLGETSATPHKRSIMLLGLAIVMCAMLCFAGLATAQPAYAMSQKQQGSYMTKALRAFESGDFSTTAKYAKKLPKKADKKMIGSMSKAARKAYNKKLVSLVRADGFSASDFSFVYSNPVRDYYLFDVTNDGRTDLVVCKGMGRSALTYDIYTYKNGKAKRIKSNLEGGRGVIMAYLKHKGFLLAGSGPEGTGYFYHLGAGSDKGYSCEDTKFNSARKLLVSRCVVKGHVKNSKMSYSALK